MLKNSITYTLIIGVLFFMGFYTHQYFIDKEQITLQFSLQKVYIFHAVFTLIVCISFRFFSKTNTISQQLGFIYIGALVFKLVFFSMLFYNPIITAKNLSNSERISLLIPMAIFLITEVLFVVQILNKK